jgi:hypothetical protein
MALEDSVNTLVTQTTALLNTVNVAKATLDASVEDAGDFAQASLTSANNASTSASTATTQASAAQTARTGAETARDAAIVAQNNAVEVVTGGTATLTPEAGKIPLADAEAKIDAGWLTDNALVEQSDIGTAPNEIPLNQYLGNLAYQDAENLNTIGVNGVRFNGVASTDANTLDDYEEGTWTPTYTPASGAFGAITYNSNTFGRYTKIGNAVFVIGLIITDSFDVGTGLGQGRISGLPFTPSPSASASINYSTNFNSDTPTGSFTSGTNIFLTSRVTANGSSASFNSVNFTTGASAFANYVYFQMNYVV